MATTIHWPGLSGESYVHYIHPIGTEFKAVGGNYIFAKETAPGRWKPIYVGETGNLGERFDDHHKGDAINRNGATHIHVHTNDNYQDRLDEETDIIRKWGPIAND